MEGTSAAAVTFCAVLTFRCILFSPCVVADPQFGRAESRLDYCGVEMDGQLLSWFRKFNLEGNGGGSPLSPTSEQMKATSFNIKRALI